MMQVIRKLGKLTCNVITEPREFPLLREESMEQKFARNRFLECVLIFKNDSEKKEFESYIYKNFNEYFGDNKNG